MRRWLVLAIVLVLSIAFPCHGRIFIANGRLDRELRDSKIVVVAGILKPTPVSEPDVVFIDGPGLSCTFRISHVILGDKDLKGKDLVYDDFSFWWPEDLVPYKAGTYCILIFRAPDEKEVTAKNAC